MDDLTFWIVAGILGILVLVFLGKYVRTSMFYFAGMDFSQATLQKMKIPVGDIELQGYLYLPKFALGEDGNPREKLPFIIYMQGWGGNGEQVFFKEIMVALAVGGPYAVLTADTRGFGKSPGKKQLSPQLFEDAAKIIDFGANLDIIDPSRIGVYGGSFGAEVALTVAYADERVKAIVVQCATHDFLENFARKPESLAARFNLAILKSMGVDAAKVTEELNKKMSPSAVIDSSRSDLNNRVFLIHAKDDPCVNFKEFEKNRAALNLPEDQVLVYKTGGHTEMRQELLTIAGALRFFKSRL
jgi:dipeptidyl aminopeptidase/acylaminoacyl peptidase